MSDLSAIPDEEWQRLFASLLFQDPRTTAMFTDHVQPAYFQDVGSQYLIGFLKEYWTAYRASPTEDVVAAQLGIELRDKKLDNDKLDLISEVWGRINNKDVSDRALAMVVWIHNTAREWLRRKALQTTAIQVAKDVADGLFDEDYAKRFRDADLVGQPPLSDGALFALDDLDLFLEEGAAQQGTRIGSGLFELDERMGGGVMAGELGVILAATGKGKTHALVYTGRNAVRSGYKVLHVSLEMDKVLVENRYLSGMTLIPNIEIPARVEEVRAVIADVRPAMFPGDIAIRQFPSRSATVSTLRGLMLQLKQARDFVPELVIIDYADLLLPATGNRNAPRYEAQEVVYEELRGFAVEHNVAVWTAAQARRDTHTAKASFDLDQTGDSYGKMRVADVVLTLSSANLQAPGTDPAREDEDEGRILTRYVLPAKVRNGPSHRQLKVTIDAALSIFDVAPADSVLLGGSVEEEDAMLGVAVRQRARVLDAESA